MPESKLLQPPVLDARLAAAAAYVRPGCVAADVGCDHGRLSVALAAQGKCRKIIASDIRPAPLATAQRLVTLHGCEDVVECRLGAGLSVPKFFVSLLPLTCHNPVSPGVMFSLLR